MAYRVVYRDATGTDRLVGAAPSPSDASNLIGQVTAQVPLAVGRLTAMEDPVLGLNLHVVQPPQTLETAAGRPVLYFVIRPVQRLNGLRLGGHGREAALHVLCGVLVWCHRALAAKTAKSATRTGWRTSGERLSGR